ncbi:hypothetical protein [Maribellus sediminis]|uniref:hypothetical protein n=1 Tax=Maribellus sediminis TaxID=2696285 RepID=UPI0014310645|nr:hypothetical protein [Maribellus sediminis]
MYFKSLLLLLLCFSLYFSAHAQKEYINREVAQKNYEGYMLMQDSNYTAALKLLDEALTEDPEAFFIYQNRAICKLNLKDTLGAIADFKKNIELEPQNAETKYALGNIYKNQLDSVNASSYFRQAIDQADAEFSQVKLLYMNNFVGHVYRLEQKWDSALEYYNRVKNYTPEDASVFINSAVCYFQLDSLDRFCADLERAFVLGGNVNCIALKAYCHGCNHLLDERGGTTDTLSMILDTRLRGIIPDTVFFQARSEAFSSFTNLPPSKKVTVYFNKYWQMCLPKEAVYYRESFWSPHLNYFGGNFTDYYADGTIYATGRIESILINGAYKSYYRNGQIKVSGQFAKGLPVGKWNWYLDDGRPDFEVEFTMGDYEIHLLNTENLDYQVNSGTGEFKVTLANWDGFTFVLKGEYEDGKRTGNWQFLQNGEKVISEQYRKGEFKRGYIVSPLGQVSTNSTYLDATFLAPPYLKQIRNLYFSSEEAVKYYPFVRTSLF